MIERRKADRDFKGRAQDKGRAARIECADALVFGDVINNRERIMVRTGDGVKLYPSFGVFKGVGGYGFYATGYGAGPGIVTLVLRSKTWVSM